MRVRNSRQSDHRRQQSYQIRDIQNFESVTRCKVEECKNVDRVEGYKSKDKRLDDIIDWKKLLKVPLGLIISFARYLAVYWSINIRTKKIDATESLAKSHSRRFILFVTHFVFDLLEFQLKTWYNIVLDVKTNLNQRRVQNSKYHPCNHPVLRLKRTHRFEARDSSSTYTESIESSDFSRSSTMINPPISSGKRAHKYRQPQQRRVESNSSRSIGLITSLENLHLANDQNRPPLPPRKQPVINESQDGPAAPVYLRKRSQMAIRSTTVDASNWISNEPGVAPRFDTNSKRIGNAELHEINVNYHIAAPYNQRNCYETRFVTNGYRNVNNYPSPMLPQTSPINLVSPKAFSDISTRYYMPEYHPTIVSPWMSSTNPHSHYQFPAPNLLSRIKPVDMNLGQSSFGSDGQLLSQQHRHHHQHNHANLRSLDTMAPNMNSITTTRMKYSNIKESVQNEKKTSIVQRPHSTEVVRIKSKKSPLIVEKLSLAGANRRLGFRKKSNNLTRLNIHRSEEIIPNQARLLIRQSTIGSYSDCGTKSVSTCHSFSRTQTPESSDFGSSFIENLGKGQVVSRQALVSPDLGDIQLSLSDQKGVFEVEVIRARSLHLKAGAHNLPNPYVKVYLMKGKICIAKFKTEPVKETLDPLYQKRFVFRGDYRGCVVQVIVWGEYNRKDKKSLMGIAQIHTDEIDISESLIEWYKLFHLPSLDGVMLSSKSLRYKLLSYHEQ